MSNVNICRDSNFFLQVLIQVFINHGNSAFFIVECLKMSYTTIAKNEKLDLRSKISVQLKTIA